MCSVDLTISGAASDWLAELEGRAREGDGIKPESVAQVRCRLRKTACCAGPGTIADTAIAAVTREQVIAWYAHMTQCRGAKVAWLALVQFRQLQEFARRRGVDTPAVDYIKRPDCIPTPPSRQGGSPRVKAAPPPRLAALPKLTPASTLGDAARHWIVDIARRVDRKDAEPQTLTSYRYCARWLEEPVGMNEDGTPGPALASLTFEEIESEHVFDWYDSVAEKTSKSTASCLVKRLRTLLFFAYKKFARANGPKGVVFYDPTEEVRRSERVSGCGYVRKPPQPVAADVLPALRVAVDVLYDDCLTQGMRRRYTGRRLAAHVQPVAALRMLLLCGARSGEVARIRVEDLDGAAAYLPQTKTHAPRWIYFDKRAAEIAARQAALVGEGPLFVFNDIHTFEGSINYWLRKACELAGIGRRHAHDMRHTYAQIALAIGERLDRVMQALGHTSPKTTMRVYGEGAHSFGARAASTTVCAVAGVA